MEYEHSLLKAPVEAWHKAVRAQQRAVEKDFTVVENALKTLFNREKDRPNVENTCVSLDKIVVKLCGMKRKLQSQPHSPSSTSSTSSSSSSSSSSDLDSEPFYRALHARGTYLRTYDATKATCFRDSYNSVRDLRLIVDYLLRRGYGRTAEALVKREGLEDLVELNLFRSAQPILDSLHARNCTEALAWCKDNQFKLKKLKSPLELQLRLQDFVQKAVGGESKAAAVEYARKHFNAYADGNLAEIKRAMAALLLDPKSRSPPDRYKDLLDENRWESLIELFKDAFYGVYGMTSYPILHVALQSGILALNTQQAAQAWSHNTNDPMCHRPFQALAKKLPMTYRKNSALVCRISGSVMDSNNPPLVLPNGHVYSYQALSEMFRSIDAIVCPSTQTRYSWQDLRKAFVM